MVRVWLSRRGRVELFW